MRLTIQETKLRYLLEKATDWLQEALDNEPEDYENIELIQLVNECRQLLNTIEKGV